MPQVLIGIAVSIAISVALSIVTSLLFPPPRRQTPQQLQTTQPSIPKPSDGKFNFKQNVPSLSVVMGRVKKGGDYVFLEETGGSAFHITVIAAHRIQGFVQHYLHDEAVATDGSNFVVTPAHFDSKVRITTSVGPDVATAWSSIVGFFPTIWTNDHRGDGLAQVVMEAITVNQERYLNVFPQQMPVHTAVIDGARLYDPREVGHDPDDPSTWVYSRNIALMRLHHLTHPWGGKLNIDDLYLPDWEEAADICDELVTNRSAATEPRYAGGLWFRYENDQVEVGRKLDEAGELLLYERPDGKIGVHAGQLVTPDIRITKEDLISFRYDANRRRSSTVLAVRGRFTDPDSVYNTVDAAIYGDPYISDDDTQRSATVNNEAVQSHNHIQRLQKLRYTRANAARVTFTVDLIEKGDAEDRRFVRLHLPERGLDEAVVELKGHPTISLRNLTLTLEGIVVPSTLYSFDAATEEGAPGSLADAVVHGGVPEPENFTVGIAAEVLVGGQPAAFALGAWDFLSDALAYELEWQPSDESEVPRSVFSHEGDTELRTDHLSDGVEYRFRMRAHSGGGGPSGGSAVSDWTDYETATATADVTAPGQATGFVSNAVGSDVTLDWVNPNSPNLYKTELFRGTSASFGSAVVIYTAYGGIAEARQYVDASLAANTYYWWVRSENASGAASTEVGPTTETV